MTKQLMIEDPIGSFLGRKEDNLPLDKDDLIALGKMFVSRDVFVETQKSYSESLDRATETNEKINGTFEKIDGTLTEICATAADTRERVTKVESGHAHDAECHELTEAKIDRKIRFAVMVIAAIGLVIVVVPPVVKAFIIPLITQVAK